MSLFSLDDKVALITGSTKGIGRAIAERMAEHGARVVISSRRQVECEQVADSIVAAGGQALALDCNINYPQQLHKLVTTTRNHWGRIDVLVCNAAINPYFGPSRQIPDTTFNRIMQTNVGHVHQLCQLVLPQMADTGGGSVIIVSSIAGLKGTASLGAYAISKAADMQLARNLAVEWGPSQVRVNCIAPGLIRTDFAKALWENPDIYQATVANCPLRRIGEPDDIAGAAVLLAAPAGRFITGQTLVIDGGGTIAVNEWSSAEASP